jgi:acetolactate synthase-1/2/3 large subunit
MHNADVVISLGVRFNDRATGNRFKFATNSRIVHIDVDGSELSKNVTANVGLRGDIKMTLSALLPLLKQKQNPDWMNQIEKLREIENGTLDSREGLTPRNAILEINKRISENTPVATDVGQHQMWAAQNLVFKNQRRFISSGGLGTMGFGLGAAIGAAFGTKERTVLITGDGSFGMSLNELTTAVSNNIPLVIIIMNNGVLGMVRQWQTLFYHKHYSNTVLNRKTDFTAVARAFGADGEQVDTLEDLKLALDKAFSFNGTYIIDCLIDKDEFVLPMLPPNGSTNDIIVKLN